MPMVQRNRQGQDSEDDHFSHVPAITGGEAVKKITSLEELLKCQCGGNADMLCFQFRKRGPESYQFYCEDCNREAERKTKYSEALTSWNRKNGAPKKIGVLKMKLNLIGGKLCPATK